MVRGDQSRPGSLLLRSSLRQTKVLEATKGEEQLKVLLSCKAMSHEDQHDEPEGNSGTCILEVTTASYLDIRLSQHEKFMPDNANPGNCLRLVSHGV